MLLHSLKCRKIPESKNPNVTRTKNGRMFLQNVQCVIEKIEIC